ncbi:uncharacterized protein K02A2.6-like [Prunus avium]|uniref:Uncharacterized protein K02A2.6-like n=1 Tax=Prunus avium TaxID=42229 RepID=A0A6P5S4S3_PRUAV|nr:uncharacterized protein K02A2.6-like [Prunus avium]
MPQGKGQVKFAIVAVDYITKWTEAEALATITAARVEHFVWKNIICRFGLPNAIITDNGKQFDSTQFWHLYHRFNINLFFSSPAHPQSNGQVEAINKIIKRTLKKKLGAAKGAWPDLLPEALWAINTSYRRSTGETPFSLAFDWVLRKVSLATKDSSDGTLGPSWEGPYEVVTVCRPGTYRLRDTDGQTLGHPWNIEHLKYYYK